MENPIDIRQIPLSVRQILERLDVHGFETWLVGGCVRDLCLGLTPKDFDLATSALPEQVQALFPHHFATGLEHGTVTVMMDHDAIEVTTFRSEGSYSDSRRPDLVIFHNQIEADLARRDFTMNSMAYRPDRGILDLHGGLADLHRRILRSVGNPQERFNEDALRMLRAIRFTVMYDLSPDMDLVQAAVRMSSRLDRLSRERVAAELQQILGSPYPGHLRDFAGCGLLKMAAILLLGIRADDRTICERLSSLIDPELLPEQRLPLLFLVASAGCLDVYGLLDVLMPLFESSVGHRFQHLLMHESRVSRKQAQSGEAMLYLMFLRLLLPVERSLIPVEQRRLLRLLARRCHLEASALMAAAFKSDSLLRLCLTGARSECEPASSPAAYGQVDGSPLTLAQMNLNGRQLQALGWHPGPKLRIMMERMLSRIIEEPALNRPADLLALAYDLEHLRT